MYECCMYSVFYVEKYTKHNNSHAVLSLSTFYPEKGENLRKSIFLCGRCKFPLFLRWFGSVWFGWLLRFLNDTFHFIWYIVDRQQ